MEQKRQCPKCGKYVAADRTYCMNCGVTLGIRCLECRAVMPVGAKACTACGHSFVKKRKTFRLPMWEWMKKNAKPLTLGLPLLLLVLTLVAAAFPAVNLAVLVEGDALFDHTVSGYELMGSFLGGHPRSAEDLLALKELQPDASLLRVLFFAEGLGWLAVLAGLLMAVVLVIPNYKRFGKLTASRLYLPLGVVLGGGGVAFGMTPVVVKILAGGMASYAARAEEGYVVDTAVLVPLLLLIAVGLLMVTYTLLYFAVFRKAAAAEGEEMDETGEMSLGQILAVPVGAVGRFIHRVIRKIRIKRGKAVSEREEPVFTVTHRFTAYVIIFVVSLVFTQALLSKVSNIFFWFIFILPWVLLIYVLLAKGALSVSMLSDTVTIEKNTPYTYEFRIDNHSPLSIPFIDAMVSIPQSNSVRCSDRTVRLSVAPLTGYHLKNTVSFRFRGTYDIGIRCFYVYDFFRIFRVRVDVENLTTVYVLPRRLTLEEASAHAVSDDTARTVKSPLTVDKLEVSDIRDYQNGDSLKSIHWKLSSKSENFIVKDYNTGTSNQTVVFCDLTPHYPDEPPKKKAPSPTADGSAEGTAGDADKKTRKDNRKKKKEQARLEADLRRKRSRRIKEDANTHAISDEALKARLDQRNAVADSLDAKNGVADGIEEGLAVSETEVVEVVDVHEPAKAAFYEDMNEYLADGVVELTIATVLAELRRGREVLLLWFDRRADGGVFCYTLRGVDEFENVYHLFATAPLCAPDLKVTSLTAMIGDIQSAKQTFVVSVMDSAMLTDLCGLPGVSDAGSFGSAEVVLYNPEERFRYPRERAGYLEGCREQLGANGLTLVAGSFNIHASPDSSSSQSDSVPEGGVEHEKE